jgi:hypothetical protein
MAEILTSWYKADLMRRFYEDTQDNEFYMLIGNDVTDVGAKITSVNSHYSQQRFLNHILFGKKIDKNDIKFMIKYNPWQEGQVFDQYDDKTDLSDKKFYCVVGPNLNKTGDYRVFKCIDNNDGGAVRQHPEFQPDQTTYPIATDGYVWEYMFRITAAEFEAYNANGFVPIMGDFNRDPYNENANTGYTAVSPTTGSEITQILLENPDENFGYPTSRGKTDSITADGTVTVDPFTNFPLNEITDYYAGMTLRIENDAGNTFLYEIVGYEYDETNNQGNFELRVDNLELSLDGISDNQTYNVAPTIKIEGDGTGATAYPILKDNIIQYIQVSDVGSGYNTATATVIDPQFDFDPEDDNTVDTRAIIRPVLSPKNGHNFDPILELESRRLLMYAYITEADNGYIGDTNTFSYVGLVKNPEWANTAYANSGPDVFDNRIAVVTDDYTNATVNGLILQTNANNDVIFQGKVHEIDSSANTIYISEYVGPYENVPGTSSSFDTDYNLQNESGTTITINTPVAQNVTTSPYTQRSGIIYFMEDITPLERTTKSREEFKLVLEF